MRAEDLDREMRALSSAPGHVCFSLTEDLHGWMSVGRRYRQWQLPRCRLLARVAESLSEA